jgi:hypothetical protein
LSLFLAAAAPHTGVMAEITAILVAGGFFIAGFVAWYAMWHGRTAAALKRVPVRAARSALVVRRGADLPDNTR